MLEDQGMSVQEAAAVLQDARTRAHRELIISTPAVYTAWGLVWLIGYGGMWLSVRGQHPYRGPSGISIAAVFLLAGLAIVAVLTIARRAVTGIDGQSVRYRRIVLATWATGYLIVLVAQAGINGMVSARTLAFVGFAGPVLVAGLSYLLASALGRNRPALWLGIWLVIAGVGCAWQSPSGTLAICALAGGGGFLLVAAVETWTHTHDK